MRIRAEKVFFVRKANRSSATCEGERSDRSERNSRKYMRTQSIKK